MISQTLVILVGLGVAGWGHLLVHDLLGAGEAWSRADAQFPPALQSTPSFAGGVLLLMGALLVVLPALA